VRKKKNSFVFDKMHAPTFSIFNRKYYERKYRQTLTGGEFESCELLGVGEMNRRNKIIWSPFTLLLMTPENLKPARLLKKKDVDQ
jgi:hypothetical protein